MPERKGVTTPVRLLAISLALLIWLFVAGERPVERELTAPLRIVNLPAGLLLAEGYPPAVTVTVRGSGLRLTALRSGTLGCIVDLARAREGVSPVSPGEHLTGLPAEVDVVRTVPAELDLRLTRSGEPGHFPK